MPDSCTCPQDAATTSTVDEARTTGGTSRRSLLRGGLAALGLAAAEPLVSTRYAYAAAGYTGDVVVVLSLRGGFDGLSAVAPVGDPAYGKARPTIAVPASAAIRLDSRFGLHPALAPLKPFWDAGTFGVVHAVGQAAPTRSHFAAMEEMERAAPGTGLRTGWLDRTLGLRPAGTTFRAVQVGGSGASPALAGPTPELALDAVDDFTLSAAWDDQQLVRWRTALAAVHRGAPTSLAAPATATLGAVSRTAALKKAGYTPANGASYPDGELGPALRDVARLVKAGVGLQVACVEVGDWDMHAGLGQHHQGWMQSKLDDLARSLTAFATDLGSRMQGVTVVTLSEFGRRVAENGSGGLDHGHGNAVLMLGGGVRGGMVHGRWPGLAAANLRDGDLAGTTDYRQVLGEVLVRRCGATSLSSVFPGLRPAPIGVVRART